MVISFRKRERRMQGGGSRSRSFITSSSQRSLKDALKPEQEQEQEQESPNVSPQHVVIVMDALRDYSLLPLLWALENIMGPGCVVTLLGIMPWLNIPLSSKTPEVWGVEFEELGIGQANMDPKYFKLQAIVDLCKRFGVEVNKEVVMGFPLKSMVLEKIVRLDATWVVFDKHQKRNREYFGKKIGCNMVMMNENGEADMIKGQPMIQNGQFTPITPTQFQSPTSSLPTPQLIIPQQWNHTPDSH